MATNKYESEIAEILVDQCLLASGATVSHDNHFKDDLGADSLDLVELLMNLEERAHIDISDDKAAKFLTVGDVVNYLESVPNRLLSE